MASIAVFVIAFGIGCLTGVVMVLLWRNRHADDSTGAPHSLPMPADD